MIKLIDIINQIQQNPDFLSLSNHPESSDQNLFETYTILGELLNPDNAYLYQQQTKDLWIYNDIEENTYFVRIIFQPTNQPHFELKTGYFDKNNKPQYDPAVPENSTGKDWDKRSDTVAKIYRDEIIPYFLNQSLSNILTIKPLEIKRYQFSVRLINKFTPTDKIDIKYNKPQSINLIKK
jgi:hypothetical protein